ncbi:MAG: hypothetical protein LBR18_01515 [Tannerella sp.]|nr:hypothetical protein [Tannerella sp.]
MTRLLVLASVIIFGIAELLVIRFCFPEHFSLVLMIIPAYFLIFAVILLSLISHIKRKKIKPGRAFSLLMLFNMAQMLVSFTALACYYIFSEVKDHTFLIAFGIFYFFFLIIKSLCSIRSSSVNQE